MRHCVYFTCILLYCCLILAGVFSVSARTKYASHIRMQHLAAVYKNDLILGADVNLSLLLTMKSGIRQQRTEEIWSPCIVSEGLFGSLEPWRLVQICARTN